jgi:aminopeptidase
MYNKRTILFSIDWRTNMDTRILKLAKLLVEYSCEIKPGEKVLVSYEGESTRPLVRQIIKEIYRVGGIPFVEIRDSQMIREIMLGCKKEQIELQMKSSWLK